MKIEFKKVPSSPRNFTSEHASVRIEGTFCKISPSLVKIDSKITGKTSVTCCRCGDDSIITFDEEFNFFISDGVFENKSSESEDLVIEVEDNIIDFDEIIQSEVSSIYSDYHICANCTDNDFIEQEF